MTEVESPTKATCVICYSEFKKHPRSKQRCGHDEICGMCFLRLRKLHSDKKCPICKSDSEHIVVENSPQRFEDYPIWGNDLGSDYVFQEQASMFFCKPYFDSTVADLFRFTCQHKDCDQPEFGSYKALQDHLRKEHRLTFCNLCVENKRDFVNRLPRFSPTGLARHNEKSHHRCEFCNKFFYDISMLHAHLNQEHFKCHICEKQASNNIQFFKDYVNLEHHFQQAHFLCPDPVCLQNRFVVFENELDYQHHQRTVHGVTNLPTISLSFQTSRRRPPEAQEVSIMEIPSLHPQHVARTQELQEQARQIREMESAAEAFPSLDNSNNNSNALEAERGGIVGWASDDMRQRLNPRVPTAEESFPALPAPAKTNKLTTLTKKKRATATPAAANWNHTARNTGSIMSSKNTLRLNPGFSQTTGKNKSTNLTADNFPSLGPGSAKRPGYAAAQAFAARPKPPPGSFAAASSTGARRPVSQAFAAKPAPNLGGTSVPSLGASDFPSLANGSSTKTKSNGVVRYTAAEQLARKINPNHMKPPPKKAAAWGTGKAAAPPSVAETQSLDDLKTILGANNYKVLKRLTREFGNRELDAVGYIDHAANVFGGYDDNFWKYVPQLIASTPTTPNVVAAAKRYLNELQVSRNGALNAESQKQAATKPNKKKSSQKQELRNLAFGGR